MIVSAWCSYKSVVWCVRQVIAGLQNFDAQKVAAVVIAAEKVTPSFDQIVVKHTVVSISTRNNNPPSLPKKKPETFQVSFLHWLRTS